MTVAITVDHDEYTEVGAWRIETVPLSSVVDVRHREDMVALVTSAGVVKFIGPLGDGGSTTLSHGLPTGATWWSRRKRAAPSKSTASRSTGWHRNDSPVEAKDCGSPEISRRASPRLRFASGPS